MLWRMVWRNLRLMRCGAYYALPRRADVWMPHWPMAMSYKFVLAAASLRYSVRYLKRGVNDKGHVANEVEVEQMLVEQRVRMDPCDCSEEEREEEEEEEEEDEEISEHSSVGTDPPVSRTRIRVSPGSGNDEGVREETPSAGGGERVALEPAVGAPCPAHVHITHMSAVVQVRGSVPLFWSQEASGLTPKPDIART